MRRLAAVLLAGVVSCAFDPALPSASDAGSIPAMCGDGVVVPTEGCDDENNRAGDGCDPTCQVETYYACSGAPSVCTNPAPDAVDDEFYVDVGETRVLDILDNDSDHDDEPIRIHSVMDTIFGIVEHDDEKVIFTGTSSGVDFVSYQIRDLAGNRGSAEIQLRVGVPNRPPRARSKSVTMDLGATVGIRLEAIDEDDDNLTFRIERQPALGTIASLAGDLATYTANAGQTGRDQFTFTAFDSELRSATATITVDIVGSWWNPAWTRRRRIRIDTTGFTNVAHVPVRIPFASVTSLINEGARTDGGDLRFVSLDGQVVLPHELVGWPETYAAAWIDVEDFDAPEVALWLYYGRSDAPAPTGSPWTTDYASVFHFDDDVVDTITGQSGGNDFNLGFLSSLTGRGLVVDEEESATLDLANRISLDVGATCLWMRAGGNDGPVVELSRSSSGQGPAGELSLRLTNDRLECVMNDGNDRESVTTGQTIENGWHYLCVRYDTGADTVELVKNGIGIGMFGATGAFEVDRVGFAHPEDGFDGPVDELWIMNTKPTDDWVRAQAVLGAGSVISVGSAETQP